MGFSLYCAIQWPEEAITHTVSIRVQNGYSVFTELLAFDVQYV